MEINLQLFSILRDKLPSELKGRTIMHLNEGATLKDLLKELEIKGKVVISVNDIQETDHSRQLIDGEKVMIFSSVGGG
ncbi:MAG: MoaD/ThiS family protein [Anaerolineales bacterium]